MNRVLHLYRRERRILAITPMWMCRGAPMHGCSPPRPMTTNCLPARLTGLSRR